MKKLLLLILPVLLLLTTVNINVKAAGDNWYTPDLAEYTFNIPYEGEEKEDFIFKMHDFTSGNFSGFLYRQYDFGVTQNSDGALDFTSIYQTLLWVGLYSVQVSGGGGGVVRYGLTPMIIDSLPGYVSYNIYNTYDRTAYKGAVDKHVITYRLDFLGNYSMLLEDYKYDIVYSLEVKYDLTIYYFDLVDTVLLKRGYTIHWYDTSEMKEYELYTTMNSNLLQFELISISEGSSEDFKMNDMHILLITLIMFILSIFIYFKFRIKWVLIATILLWFVPIFLVENLFIKIFSVIMILVTITITFFNDREEEY
ncbi:MAG TPA: hypothetical protein VIK77_05870 [Tissierellaceae bacterium]